MAGSTTNIDQLSTQDRSKEATINELIDAASPAMLFGRQASECSGLTWGYYGGTFRNGSGLLLQLPNDKVTLTASQTNYVQVYGSGVVHANTTGFLPECDPLYTVVCNSTAVESWIDQRTGMQGEVSGGKHVVTIPYNANVTVDWSQGYDVVRITATGTLTLTFQNGADGQVMIFEIKQGPGGGKTINLPGNVRYCTDIPTFTPSTSAGLIDKLGFMCSSEASPNFYDLMAVAKGYT